jgi:methylmalonyl-CoA mutase cobalamin-binding subunit
VFLALIGEPAMYAARADFIVNFLAAGGIEALSGEGSKDATEAASGFMASGAAIACICSSDRLYAELVAATARALRAAGARKVLLAGRPQGVGKGVGEGVGKGHGKGHGEGLGKGHDKGLGEGLGEALWAAGIDACIVAGDDALATLAMLHRELGVAT